MIFGAVFAIVAAETFADGLHPLAHVYCPGIVRVAGQEAVFADFDAVCPDVVVVVADIPRVGVCAHVCFLLCFVCR